MLCDKCHERAANVHVTTITDDRPVTRDLCKECYEAEASPDQLERIRKLRAQGGGAASGRTGSTPEPG